MKKKIISLILTFVLLLPILASILAGCESFKAEKVEGVPDKKYAVTSNGGLAVQWGNYIYFINGYKDIKDEDGKNNVWGEVVRGGIYRAELIDGNDTAVSDYYGSYLTYDNTEGNNFNDNDENYIGFKTQTKTYKDDDGVEQTIDEISAVPIAKKLVTNSDYVLGGLYIIDDYIYYTTPNIEKDKKGNIQYNLVDFYRTKVDGTGTQRLYTSKDADNKPSFGYYKYNNNVYLVVKEGTELKSIEIKGKKIRNAEVIAQDIESVIFPQKEVYYPGISQDMAEDYIYYTRTIDKKVDTESVGNILERVRPNGDNATRKKILSGITITLDKVSQGTLYYFTNDNVYQKYYADRLSRLSGTAENAVMIFSESASSAPTNVYGFFKGGNDKDYGAIGKKSNKTYVYAYPGAIAQQITTQNAYAIFNDGNILYFVDDSTEGDIYRMNLYTGQELAGITDSNIKYDFLGVDRAAGYMFFVSTVNKRYAEIEDSQTGEVTKKLYETKYYLQTVKMGGVKYKIWEFGVLDDIDLPNKETDN